MAVEQPAAAEVVIIGGGLVGTSIAYHLARLGVTDIVLCERDALGSGSTGRNAGGLRQQFTSAVNVRLSQATLELFQRMPEELGVDPGFQAVGYLFLATREADLELFRQDVEIERALGVPVRLVTSAEAAEIVPGLNVEDVLGGTFCPLDGHGDPSAVLQGFARHARRLGVRILEDTPIVGIDREGDRVTGVRTPRGRIGARQVVIAAGAWSGEVGRLAGVDIPIWPIKRQIFVTGPFPGMPVRPPLTIDFATGFYFHGEGQGMLMGIGEPDEQPDSSTQVEWERLPRLVEHAVHRLPAFAEADVRHGWAGLYEVTPDHNALVGPWPGVEGLWINAGYSGHGFQHAPTTGRLTAELLTTGRSSIDITPLAPDRFQRASEPVGAGEARFV